MDASIHAAWSANRYVLTFDAMGGSVAPGQKHVIYDGIHGELPVPEYKGRVFEGWYTQPQGGGRVEPFHDVKEDSDRTLYARYAEVDRTSLRPTGKNEWKDFEGGTYRFDRKGAMLTGLRKVNGRYYYFDAEGRLLTGGKVRLSGYTLKADSKGRITNMPSPNRTTVTKAKAPSKNSRKIKAGWKKLIGVSGYHVQYALDKYFTKEIGIKNAKGRNRREVTIDRLAPGKRYYVRVRGYFIIGGLEIPGKFSKAVRSRR
jgi:hypothetical protein